MKVQIVFQGNVLAYIDTSGHQAQQEFPHVGDTFETDETGTQIFRVIGRHFAYGAIETYLKIAVERVKSS